MERKNNNRGAQRQFKAAIDGELYDAVARVAADRRLTRSGIVTRALVLLLDELCEPVPAGIRQQLERKGSFKDRRGKWKRPARKPLFPTGPN